MKYKILLDNSKIKTRNDQLKEYKKVNKIIAMVGFASRVFLRNSVSQIKSNQ